MTAKLLYKETSYLFFAHCPYRAVIFYVIHNFHTIYLPLMAYSDIIFQICAFFVPTVNCLFKSINYVSREFLFRIKYLRKVIVAVSCLLLLLLLLLCSLVQPVFDLAVEFIGLANSSNSCCCCLLINSFSGEECVCRERGCGRGQRRHCGYWELCPFRWRQCVLAMVCVSECVLFFRIKPKDNNNNNNKKLSFCILAKFAVVVVDLDVDFDSHSTAKVSNFAFSAQYNKRSNNSNSNNNNNNVVDNVLQQFAQNIVSISDSGQRQLKKFRALLGAIINELPARFPPATLSLSL